MNDITEIKFCPSYRVPPNVIRVDLTLARISLHPGKIIQVALHDEHGRPLAVLEHKIGPELRPLGQ